MQTANIMLSLAGDSGTTVPKLNVTASEIAILQRIHGESAVFDIEPTGSVDRSDRDEIKRLHEIYTNPNRPNESRVTQMFPGAGATTIQNLADLDIDESFYKAEKRAKVPEPEKKPAKGRKGKDTDKEDDDTVFE